MTRVDDPALLRGGLSGPLLMDATLMPHRSLSPKGFLILMGLLCALSFIAGLTFVLKGAWPVFGFLGLDVALVWLAFRANYRDGRLTERVQLSERDLLIRRISPAGHVSAWRFEPYWARVTIDPDPDARAALTVTSHGRSIRVGHFLTDDERLNFGRALQDVLRRVKAAPVDEGA